MKIEDLYHEALIVLELPNATDEQREVFYKILQEENWVKLDNLTTAWKTSFNEGSTRDGAIHVLKIDLDKAKNVSNVTQVNYAIQLDLNQIIQEQI